jgi:hypothetical protein
LRFDLPGTIGDFVADDLHSKGGKIGLDCGSRDEQFTYRVGAIE